MILRLPHTQYVRKPVGNMSTVIKLLACVEDDYGRTCDVLSHENELKSYQINIKKFNINKSLLNWWKIHYDILPMVMANLTLIILAVSVRIVQSVKERSVHQVRLLMVEDDVS